jgi:2,3-bisphosphoglycerate-dependent phosphoglycerate mutase
MRNLYVVTHPEATHHVDRLVGGWYDSHLTPAGLAAADSIGARLRATIPPDAMVELYTSDLQRTHETATAIGKHLRRDPQIDRGLREKSYGEAEGKPQDWLDRRFIPPPASGDRLHHDEGVRGSETRWMLAERVYASMDRIRNTGCPYQIIVTHGFAAQMVVAWWIGMPLAALGHVAFNTPSGSITELREDDFFHNRQVYRLGDLSHLADQA